MSRRRSNLIELWQSPANVVFPFVCTTRHDTGSIKISRRLHPSGAREISAPGEKLRAALSGHSWCLFRSHSCGASLERLVSREEHWIGERNAPRGSGSLPLGGVHTVRKEKKEPKEPKERRTLHFYWHITFAAPRHCKQASKPSLPTRWQWRWRRELVSRLCRVYVLAREWQDDSPGPSLIGNFTDSSLPPLRDGHWWNDWGSRGLLHSMHELMDRHASSRLMDSLTCRLPRLDRRKLDRIVETISSRDLPVSPASNRAWPARQKFPCGDLSGISVEQMLN